ncbi:hypothetical protein C4573_07190 [Candidatus Woesearchaeota archaeon]|nr:MAG: hypothetical protein C4573_07190 [Candidatus Woesearchaeota archaeon]
MNWKMLSFATGLAIATAIDFHQPKLPKPEGLEQLVAFVFDHADHLDFDFEHGEAGYSILRTIAYEGDSVAGSACIIDHYPIANTAKDLQENDAFVINLVPFDTASVKGMVDLGVDGLHYESAFELRDGFVFYYQKAEGEQMYASAIQQLNAKLHESAEGFYPSPYFVQER